MSDLKLIRSADLGLPSGSYIYRLVPAHDERLAAISSDDSLRLFDKDLNPVVGGIVKTVHASVTSLEIFGNTLCTAGRDGNIRSWDPRSNKKVAELRAPKTEPLASLACNADNNMIVAGVEVEGDGPKDAPIYLWDTRMPSEVKMQYTETHSDTVTDLRFNPANNNMLLSGSTDGLVNIFDISQTNEEDAYYQSIKHTSAVHHAGFLTISDVYILGTDETLSFHRIQSPDESEEEPPPVKLGDVRESLGCDYVIDVKPGNDAQPHMIATGSYTSQHLDLIELQLQSEGPLKYSPMSQSRRHFPGAHGEEVARDLFIDSATNSVFTCGEDGFVKKWQLQSGPDIPQQKEAKKNRKEKKKQAREERYNPY